MLAGAITVLRTHWPRARFTVFSSDPAATAREYGVKSLPGYRLSSARALFALLRQRRLFAVFGAATRCDCLVVPGGEMLRTDFGLKALLSMFERIILARLAGKPVLLLGVGAGALESGFKLNLMRWALRGMPVLTREEESAARLETLAVGLPRHAADLALFIEPEPHGIELPAGDFVAISLRDPARTKSCARMAISRDEFLTEAAKLADQAVDLGATPVFAPFCTVDWDDDRAVHSAVRERMRQPGKALEIRRELTAGAMKSLLESADLTIGMRLHACIFSLSCCRPVLALSYDEKVRKQMAQFGQREMCLPLDSIGEAPARLARFWPGRKRWPGKAAVTEQLAAGRRRLTESLARFLAPRNPE